MPGQTNLPCERHAWAQVNQTPAVLPSRGRLQGHSILGRISGHGVSNGNVRARTHAQELADERYTIQDEMTDKIRWTGGIVALSYPSFVFSSANKSTSQGTYSARWFASGTTSRTCLHNSQIRGPSTKRWVHRSRDANPDAPAGVNAVDVLVISIRDGIPTIMRV